VKTLAQLQLVFDRRTSEDILARSWAIRDYPKVDALCRKLAAG
jgi:hypothetical protein